jgi:hypothetical protein
MSKQTRFQVDSRLASLLSQEYSSTEKALKELVDNGWDADAENIFISLPAPMSSEPIIIKDDGSGMTSEEVERHYLKIAADRRVLRGVRTAIRNRPVKGRKGVGKFAGLMAASTMKLETAAAGFVTSFELELGHLNTVVDIEHLPIALKVESCDAERHGTTITLSNLHSGFAYPDATKFKQILLQEYGRERDINISIDGKTLGIDDVAGLFRSTEGIVEGVGRVKLSFAIADGASLSRQPGIVICVDGKTVGKPFLFGLDQQEDFPAKLLRRLYGEVQADGLSAHVTNGWDSLVENSELLARVINFVRPILQDAFKEKHGRELQLAQARLKKEIQLRLSQLPENCRQFADDAIKKVLNRFYGEPAEKVEAYVYVLLEALERSEYGDVLRHIAEASRSDVASIAEGLEDFGLAEMAHLVEQAKARIFVLDSLDLMVTNPSTLESQVHKALERNLWILGTAYSLFSSNKTLQRIVETQISGKYTGKRATLRPDLLLNEGFTGEYLLIEFKRPSHALRYEDYTQATTYRHDLRNHVTKKMRILIIGGSRSADFPTNNMEADVIALTFSDVISSARTELAWKLRVNN